MTLSTAIKEARKEAENLRVTVFVAAAPGFHDFFPCRKDWMESFGHGQGYKIVAEAYPSGRVWQATR